MTDFSGNFANPLQVTFPYSDQTGSVQGSATGHNGDFSSGFNFTTPHPHPEDNGGLCYLLMYLAQTWYGMCCDEPFKTMPVAQLGADAGSFPPWA